MTIPAAASAPVQATADQLKALAHPLRIRILRLCLDTDHTNQQLAEALGAVPSTTLRHVRQLVETGFLAPAPVRTGRRGAMEIPYRATRLTCRLALDGVGHPDLSSEVHIAVTEAYLAELREAGPGTIRSQLRGRTRLAPGSLRAMVERIEEVVREYDGRDEPDGEPVSYLWSLNAAPEHGPAPG